MRNGCSIMSGNTLRNGALSRLVHACNGRLLKRGIIRRFNSVFPLLVGFVSTHSGLSVRIRPSSRLTGGHRGSFNGARV